MIKRVFGPYLSASSSLTYAYLMSLPLLILYEVLIAIHNPDPNAMIRLSADIWIKSLFGIFGFDTLKFTIFIVLSMGLYVYFKERENPVNVRARWLGYMVLESAFWAVILSYLVLNMVGFIVAYAPDATGITIGQKFALSLGAGLYEELVFRVLLVPVMILLFGKLGFGERGKFVAGVITAALLFSSVHYMGSMGDVFTLQSFTFRFLFGLALNILLITRGFGIAAWTHSLYDVMVILV